MELGGSSLSFLDLFITIEEGRLETSIYSKPTDAHLYLNGMQFVSPQFTDTGYRKGCSA